LKALLHIMLHDQWEGQGLENPAFRKLFTRESLLASDWYAARLAAKQKIDRHLWRRHIDYLDKFLKLPSHVDEAERLDIAARLNQARKTFDQVNSSAYLESLRGTIGAEPIGPYLHKE
jgi:phosphoenolpyruvate carboxykinase (diphosphate)